MVRVVDDAGTQHGVMEIEKALDMAMNLGIDLVEVSPNADPPVCRLMDYGKFKYQQSKKQQNNTKTHHTAQTKEIKFRPFTGDHDLEVKVRHILDFLDHGHKVKITIVFRGRELRFKENGDKMLNKVIDEINDNGVIESEKRMEGRNMVMLVAPKKVNK